MNAGEVHHRETVQNSSAWDRKPVLRAVYEDFYDQIGATLADSSLGPTVELGSGLGNIKSRIPDCITSDLVLSPGVDRVENAYRLGFDSASLGNLILFDVFHHLRYPGTALDEFLRVLRPGGRLVIFEPAMSILGRLVYGLAHKEPLGWGQPIEWRAPAAADLDTQGYYAAQANCHRVFAHGEFADQLTGWSRPRVKRFSSFAYFGSGGFSGPQLYPTGLLRIVRTLDGALARFPGLFAARMLVVLEKTVMEV